MDVQSGIVEGWEREWGGIVRGVQKNDESES